jgi:hypothetical protein
VLALLTVFAWNHLSRADDSAEVQKNLQAALVQLADSISKHLDSRQESEVVIGEFSGPGKSGPGIQEALIRALAALNKTAKPTAPLEVRGTYALDDDPANPTDAELKVLKLQAEFFLTRTGAKQTELEMRPVRVRNSLDLAKLFAVTTTFPTGGATSPRIKTVIKAINNPSVHIDGTRISSSPDSPYAVEILVRPQQKKDETGVARAPNPELSKNGQAFVDLRAGELYEVRISNRSQEDVAVTLTIDGLDPFTFSEVLGEDGKPRYKHMIFEKPQPGRREASGTIRGWHRVNSGEDAAYSFLATEYGKGEASKLLKSSAKTGTIVVTFAPARSQEGVSEDPDRTVSNGDGPAGETGKGPGVETNLEEFSGKIGAVREVVSIRYSR